MDVRTTTYVRKTYEHNIIILSLWPFHLVAATT
jgi:hypothetical protein